MCVIDSMYLSEVIGELSAADVNKLLKHCLASISSLLTSFTSFSDTETTHVTPLRRTLASSP